jgi:hypothetical protein
MKVTTNTIVLSPVGPINSGWTFEADETDKFYIIKEGFLKGCRVSKCACDVVTNFSEKEWNDMENHYMSLLDKERAAKDRAIDMVASLGKQIVKKNAEIEKLEFYVSALSIGLSASSEAIKVLREKEKV